MRIYIKGIFILSCLVMVGVGCARSTIISRCYVLDEDPTTLVSISYDEEGVENSYGDIQSIITISDIDGANSLATPGLLRDGYMFVYATGDYFEMNINKIIGHQPMLSDGFAPTIDGMTATEIECK